MATMVLTAVGTVLGGPIGAAIGAALGQMVDTQILFAPKGRQGPRLSDLRLQTSRYGDGVPRLFGAMRVAGSVIWATDLMEHRQRQSSGKGQPKVTTYSYSASFAVALSSRRIREVRRIWADGNLLRGAGRDFKTAIGAFHLHDGDEDQPVDPLIAAHKGLALTPAHRGIAYAVFEDMQLADYGNRIPSLTFEVVADDGEITVVDIADDLTGGAIRAGDGDGGDRTLAVMGYAAAGPSIADALSPLSDGFDLALFHDADALYLAREAESEILIPSSWVGGRFNETQERGISRSRGRAEEAPMALSLLYYDPARDYQAGSQRAEMPGGGRLETSLELPAALAAGGARTLAETQIRRLWTGRSMMELRCDWRALSLSPAMVVRVEGHAGRWRIEQMEWKELAVHVRLKLLGGGAAVPSLPASSGESLLQPDALHGPTSLILAELPAPGDDIMSAPFVVVAAGGTERGWRGAEIFVKDPVNAGLTSLGGTALPATMGQLRGLAVAGASPVLFDDISRIEVELLNEDMVLHDADDATVLAGANRALLGREVIQFGRATPLGLSRWRLEHCLRGRRGTEWAMALHQPGERFLLLEEQTLVTLAAESVPTATALIINAIGMGDAHPAEAREDITGQAILPLSPVHARAVWKDEGWHIGWVRRSRAGWRWMDYVDAPLVEEQERYHIIMHHEDVPVREVQTTVPYWIYDANAIAGDRARGFGGVMKLSIRQLGTHGVGQAASLFVTI